jgi:hypothetical protein
LVSFHPFAGTSFIRVHPGPSVVEQLNRAGLAGTIQLKK